MQFTRFCTPLIKQADCLSIAVPQLLGQEGLSAESVSSPPSYTHISLSIAGFLVH